MTGDALLDAVAGQLADDLARDSLTATDGSSGGIAFSHKLSVTAFGMRRIIRFG